MIKNFYYGHTLSKGPKASIPNSVKLAEEDRADEVPSCLRPVRRNYVRAGLKPSQPSCLPHGASSRHGKKDALGSQNWP